jgi:hypothetical protein
VRRGKVCIHWYTVSATVITARVLDLDAHSSDQSYISTNCQLINLHFSLPCSACTRSGLLEGRRADPGNEEYHSNKQKKPLLFDRASWHPYRCLSIRHKQNSIGQFIDRANGYLTCQPRRTPKSKFIFNAQVLIMCSQRAVRV